MGRGNDWKYIPTLVGLYVYLSVWCDGGGAMKYLFGIMFVGLVASFITSIFCEMDVGYIGALFAAGVLAGVITACASEEDW